MKPDAVIIMTADAEVIADLVRIGCAATAAMRIPPTAAVEMMRRDRALKIGAAFLDEIAPVNDDE